MIEDMIPELFDFVLLAFRRRRQKTEEWRGVLEDKRIKGNRSLARRKYVLHFRIETGKKRKIRVDQDEFELYEKGKNYRKNRGEMLPDPGSAI